MTLNVALGTTIDRTWDDARADGYAYGPKQTFDPKTGETRVYLPYGNNPRLYADLRGMKLTDTTHDDVAVADADGSDSALTYSVIFNRPVGAYRLVVGCGPVKLSGGQAGIEYSTNGREWNSAVAFENATAPSAMIDRPGADGLNTTTLHLRFYARGGAKLRFDMSGNPAWGDSANTFFSRQLQLVVTPALQ